MIPSKVLDPLRAWVEIVCSDDGIAALCADGWPAPMARLGLAQHRVSWDIDVIAQAAILESKNYGGWDALCKALPSSVGHIWPALPGAGVAPVLYMALAGLDQSIQLSSRGQNFSRFVVDCAPAGIREVPQVLTTDVEAIVVSGSDETLAAVRQQSQGQVIVGYGHRVSFAVTDGRNPDAIARDIVTWGQGGCFSVRAVVFVGTQANAKVFGCQLAQSIADLEHAWGLRLTEDQASQRMQNRALAEFSSEVFGDGLGWVALTPKPWNDSALSAHSVTLHQIDDIGSISNAIYVAPKNIQGVALDLETADPRWLTWAAVCKALGTTRTAQAGDMQSPPGDWLHDGRPNLGCLLE